MEIEKTKVKKPIFIIGVPRSGTTLLYNILSKHPHLGYFTSDDLEFMIPKDKQKEIIQNWKKLKFEIKKVPQNEDNFFASMAYRKSLGQKIPKPISIEGEIFWKKYFGFDFITDVSDEVKSTLSKEISSLLERQKKQRFLNKAPQNCMRLSALQKCFPDGKFICILRDPRSVISSALERQEKEGSFDFGIPIKNIEKFNQLNSVEKWAWAYQEILEQVYKFSLSQDKGAFLKMEYEKLASNPESVIHEIFDFCEIDVVSSLTSMIPQISDMSEKWKSRITKNDEKKIFDIVNPILQKMKYSFLQTN